jgi:heparan-sulfate lyase
VLFVDHKYFIIIDRANGSATGKLGIHFQLKEDSRAVFDPSENTVHTSYADGNNLLIQSFSGMLKEEQGKVSYAYRQEVARPAFVFEQSKQDNKPRYFITVVYPYDGQTAPAIQVKESPASKLETGQIKLSVTINGETFPVTAQIL